jgi:hypothetical protein
MIVKEVEKEKVRVPVHRPVWPRIVLYIAGIIALIATTIAVLRSEPPVPGRPSGIFESSR